MESLSAEIDNAVQPGQHFDSTVELFLLSTQVGGREGLVVGVPKEYPLKAGIYTAPPSVDTFLAENSNWPEVVRVLPKGTDIEVTRIEKIGALLWGYSYRYYATLHIEGEQSVSDVVIDDILYNEYQEKDDMFIGVPDLRFIKYVAVSDL